MKDFLEKYAGHLTRPGKSSPLLDEGSRSSVHQQVYEEIRDAILSSVLEPGQKMVVEDMAADMAVSAAPVREALLRLESENLVTYQPQKGFAVAPFTPDDLKEIYFLRGLLEGVAAGLAAHNLSEEELSQLDELCGRMEKALAEENYEEMPVYNVSFHQAIYAAARSPRLYKMIVQLWNSFPKSSISVLTLRAPEMVSEHRAIFKALQGRDPEKSEKTVRDHVQGAFSDLAEYWSHLSGDVE
ncbi:MAG: GntR family transcriptional regulator [Bacillota bacterium]